MLASTITPLCGFRSASNTVLVESVAVHCVFAYLCTQTKIECAFWEVFFHIKCDNMKKTQKKCFFSSLGRGRNSNVKKRKKKRWKRYVKYGTKWTIDRSYQVCLTDAEIFRKKQGWCQSQEVCVFHWSPVWLLMKVNWTDSRRRSQTSGGNSADTMVLPFWRRQRRRSALDSRWWTSCWPPALCCC